MNDRTFNARRAQMDARNRTAEYTETEIAEMHEKATASRKAKELRAAKASLTRRANEKKAHDAAVAKMASLTWTADESIDAEVASAEGATFSISQRGDEIPEMTFRLTAGGTEFRVPAESTHALKLIAEREVRILREMAARRAAEQAAFEACRKEQARMTRSLLRTLKHHGFTAYRLIATTPGGGGIVRLQNEAELIEALIATDEARLNVTHDLTGNGARLLLVFGNSAEELVADWTEPTDDAVRAALNTAIDEYTAKNEGR